ncbi:FUSC family protein [Microbacterium sp. NPDC089318]
MSLFAFGPSRGPRWHLGLQAALGMAVPIAVMTLLGQPMLGYIAASGAFTVLFAGSRPVRERAVMLPFVAAAIIICAALGVAAAHTPLLIGIGIVLVAVVSAALAFGFRLGPPGPLFFVLVFGLSATVMKSAPIAPVGYVVAIATGCTFSYVLAVTPLVLTPAGATAARPLRELFPGPSWDANARMLVLRVVLVSVVGVVVSLFLDPARAYWVVGAAIAVIGIASSRRAALERATHRMLGTIAGAGLYALLAMLHPSGLWLAALLGILQFSIELVVVRHYALALMLITPLVLLLLGAATGGIGDMSVALERVIDTLAGAALGALSGLLHPREHTRE